MSGAACRGGGVEACPLVVPATGARSAPIVGLIGLATATAGTGDTLIALVPPASPLDKTGNSAFSRPRLASACHRRGVTTLVVTRGRDGCLCAGEGFVGGRVRLPCGAADRRVQTSFGGNSDELFVRGNGGVHPSRCTSGGRLFRRALVGALPSRWLGSAGSDSATTIATWHQLNLLNM